MLRASELRRHRRYAEAEALQTPIEALKAPAVENLAKELLDLQREYQTNRRLSMMYSNDWHPERAARYHDIAAEMYPRLMRLKEHYESVVHNIIYRTLMRRQAVAMASVDRLAGDSILRDIALIEPGLLDMILSHT